MLILLPASQMLIDHIGWRGAYEILGSVALILLVPLLMLPWRLFAGGSPHVVRKIALDLPDEAWTLLSAMRHHAFWALFATFFFTAIGMYAISPQVVAYLIDAGFPPLQAATAWGFSGVVLLFGMLGVSWLDGIIGRRPSVADQLTRSRLSGSSCSGCCNGTPNFWMLTGFVVCFGSMIGLAWPAARGDRHEDLPRRAVRDDLRHHHHRQRSRIGLRLLGRWPDPRLEPEL